MGSAEADLVSIITPVYNSERYLSQTIQSVLHQTHQNWELILIDDGSSDQSPVIIAQMEKQDHRIRSIRLPSNSGAAIARNCGLKLAKGRYIAYLDADDLWLPKKLQRQVDFMKTHQAAFTCCDYRRMDVQGNLLNTVHMPCTITYEQLLHNTIIQTVGVMVDLRQINPELLMMPNVRRGQDLGTWLQLLKNGVIFLGQNEVLALYRITPQSLSANKWRAMKRTWHLYRSVERLPVAKTLGCMVGWAYHAAMKRIPGYFYRYTGPNDIKNAAAQNIRSGEDKTG